MESIDPIYYKGDFSLIQNSARSKTWGRKVCVVFILFYFPPGFTELVKQSLIVFCSYLICQCLHLHKLYSSSLAIPRSVLFSLWWLSVPSGSQASVNEPEAVSYLLLRTSERSEQASLRHHHMTPPHPFLTSHYHSYFEKSSQLGKCLMGAFSLINNLFYYLKKLFIQSSCIVVSLMLGWRENGLYQGEQGNRNLLLFLIFKVLMIEKQYLCLK